MAHKFKNRTVLHIAPTPFFADRGCHMRVRGLILALKKRGVNNLLCTYHHGREIDGVKTVRIMNIPGYTKLEAGPSPYKYFADILLFAKVCQIIWQYKPDIIHGHLHEGSMIGWAARWMFFWRRLPLVFDVQGSLVGELDAHGYFKKARYLRSIFWGIEWLITRMPDHFVCSSGDSLVILKDEFKIPARQLSLVSDGSDVQLPASSVVATLRRKLNLPFNVSVVIYSGALLPAKGLSDLCGLVEAAAQDDLACHFLIVGYPLDELKQFLEKKGLSSWCTLTGQVAYEKLSEYLALAEIGIEPKKADSGEASGKLLNYMAAGLPVACYDSPNNRDILASGGFFADQNAGVSSLLSSLKLALSSPEEARRRGKIALSRSEQDYSWDAAADKVYNVYKQINN